MVPADLLAVDLTHRAVLRIKVGSADEPPAAPDVSVVNLSVCDKRQLAMTMSPLARLLDYLAWRYRLLFVVSAGNHSGPIELAWPRDQAATLLADPRRLSAAIIQQHLQETFRRRLLSPAESVNAITVGAIHDDLTGPVRPDIIDPVLSGLPATYSAHGPGFGRAIKPDVLASGGRQAFREKLGTAHANLTLDPLNFATPPGHFVAAPVAEGRLDAAEHARGTSDSTALASRLAAQCGEMLEDLRDEPGGDRITAEYEAVLLKTLLVHSADWSTCRPVGIQTGEMARLAGYGAIRSDWLLSSDDHRVTILGWGDLGDGEAHRYELPIPPAMLGQRISRIVTVTLSWLTPTFPGRAAYRGYSLWFDPYGARNDDGPLMPRLHLQRSEVDYQLCRRGTVQHEVFRGGPAVAPTGTQSAFIQVNCRGEQGDATKVPYGLAITVEVPEGIAIYDVIRAQLRAAVQVPVVAAVTT